METFATAFIALYVAHHIGDYWVQTDHQAKHKGLPGWTGRYHCLLHVLTYGTTQALALWAVRVVTDIPIGAAVWPALAISGATHYLADRREYGLLFKVARLLPGKADFLRLGAPRQGVSPYASPLGTFADRDDNPTLGTGAWALDQSWHILFGCFVPALVLAA